MKMGRTQTREIKRSRRARGLIPVLCLILLCCAALPVKAASPASTAVAITSITPNPAYTGQQVNIHIKVTAADPASGVPTGQVEIRSGQNRVCAAQLDAGGEAACTLRFDDPAVVSLKAIYLGTNAFLPATSAVSRLTVRAKHAPVVEVLSHTPDPSILNQLVDVSVRVLSDGPQPTGSVTIWRGSETCAPPPTFTGTDSCSASLSGGTGSCSLRFSASGEALICASYGGDEYNDPARSKPEPHFVSGSNSYTVITGASPEPSLLGDTVWFSFQVGSPAGTPQPTDLVKVTSGALSCTATVAQGRCPLTFTTPHLHEVTAAYQGGAAGTPAAALEPSTSRVYVHRVNAPPTDIRLSSQQVPAYLPVGSEVAEITGLDPNPDEPLEFRLVSGAGSRDNSLFQVDGSKLLLAAPIPQGADWLYIRLRAVDPARLDIEKTFQLKVIRDAPLPATGFPAGQITRVLPQPVEKSYQQFDQLTLEIPALGVDVEITGVPNSGGEWDTTWLSNQAGWLNGTAFPGWRGNSVLAAHNILPSGLPGPFAQIHRLRWGDKILVHGYGETAVYEVRSVETVDPDQSSVLAHEDSPWLTLITCKTYDEATGTYLKRVVVKAKLAHVR